MNPSPGPSPDIRGGVWGGVKKKSTVDRVYFPEMPINKQINTYF
jgi:hypothetical protein